MEPQGTAAARTLATLALALVLGWPHTAAAEPKDPAARRHLADGQAALGRDEYDAAIEAYRRALHIEREPKVLYLLGQAEFLRGDCRASVRYFAEIKEFDVSPAVQDAMRPYLAECAERLLEEPEPAPGPAESEPEPIDEESEPEPAAAIEPSIDEPEKARRWYQDPLGDALVATGVLGVGAGASLLGVAFTRRASASSYGELEGEAASIRTFRTAGGASAGVGAALLVGGLVRWGVVSRRSRGTTARVGLALDETAAVLTVRGRF